MSQNEPLTPVIAASTEALEISPAVAEALERAHSTVINEIEHFEAMQKSPFGYYWEKISGMIHGILGTPVDPQELSEIITNKKEYKKQIAANEERFEQAA